MVTALDVGLSNLSLVTITLTFYTMVKSSTPVFVLGWAYLFNVEKITWPLIGVIVVIASGEFLTVFGEVDFVIHGFLLCLTASILSGARWTLVQMKLQRLDPPLKSTFVTMKLLAPSMFWSMLLISMVVERPWIKLKEHGNFDELSKAFALGLIGGFFAVFMILCEFYLILQASAIILMIGGVIKELTTIIIGVSLFGDQLNLINTTGVCIVFSGVLLYKVVFHINKNDKAMEAVPTEELLNEEEMDFADEEIVESFSKGSYHDKDSDEELDDYEPTAGDELMPEQSVEMVEHGGDFHKRPLTRTISHSSSTSRADSTKEVV
jgi:solute carrier family 35 protein C2